MKKQYIGLIIYYLGIVLLYVVTKYFNIEHVPDIILGFTGACIADEFWNYIEGGRNGRDITMDKEHSNRNSRDN